MKRLAPAIAWRRTVGDGLSGVLVKDDQLVVTYLRACSQVDLERDEQQRKHTEVIAALDVATGETIWEVAYEAGWRKEQAAFGGRSRCPQATPIIVGDQLVAIGFTGKIHCLNRHSGEILWKIDAVEKFGAIPVQFGFSASPIAFEGTLILLVGGQQGGLVALDIATGDLKWNVPCGEASYATPLLFQVNDFWQVAFVTRHEVIGVDASTGQKLWQYPLPKAGLTNVPTPLFAGDGKLIISGQGVDGTRQLCLSQSDKTWRVDEGWFNRAKFFVNNWAIDRGTIIGCDDDLLLTIDVASGKQLDKRRGYAHANLLLLQESLIMIGGDGELIQLVKTPDSWQANSRFKLLETRCWVPPTLAGDRLLCRLGLELICVELAASADLTRLEPAKGD